MTPFSEVTLLFQVIHLPGALYGMTSDSKPSFMALSVRWCDLWANSSYNKQTDR